MGRSDGSGACDVLPPRITHPFRPSFPDGLRRQLTRGTRGTCARLYKRRPASRCVLHHPTAIPLPPGPSTPPSGLQRRLLLSPSATLLSPLLARLCAPRTMFPHRRTAAATRLLPPTVLPHRAALVEAGDSFTISHCLPRSSRCPVRNISVCVQCALFVFEIHLAVLLNFSTRPSVYIVWYVFSIAYWYSFARNRMHNEILFRPRFTVCTRSERTASPSCCVSEPAPPSAS